MNENKNKYILVEEVSIILRRISESDNNLKKMILLVYEQGKKTKEAYIESNIGKDFRTCQRKIKKYSNGLISFRDLRRSYLFSNPNILYARNKQNIRKPLNPKLRWQVLSRDGFRCIACGKSSKETILHVDHIIPFSLGGETSLKNLRTLCGECNIGRGNILLEVDMKTKKEVKK